MQTPNQRGAFDRAVATLHGLAQAAHVAAPLLEVRSQTRRMGVVELHKEGPCVVIHSAALTAPDPALQALLAHEIAHIARGHLVTRRRLAIAAVLAIWLAVTFAIVFAGVQIAGGSVSPWWLWVLVAAACLAAILAPRAVQLAVYRRQEFEADRITVELLGTSEPLVAWFDWVAANTKPVIAALPVRLWTTVHPSTAARRHALAAADGGYSSSGR
jgi:Zn-dependent protease with chaperone function